MKLANSVNLYVVPDGKFKTVRILLRFREDVRRANHAKRALLANLMEEGNRDFPSGQQMAARLAMLFGATFGTNVNVHGAEHQLTAAMSVVRPDLAGEDTLRQAVEFLSAVVFKPRWDAAVFEVEKTNHLHYLQAMTDDNDTAANLALDKLYFTELTRSLPAVGSVDTVSAVTLPELTAYWDEMLATNAIDIFVVGAVTESEVAPLFASWQFDDREAPADSFYEQAVKPEVCQTVKKQAYQSILNLAFAQPIKYGDPDYLALHVMNGLYGALPHSKLFKIAREEYSLAYGIGSVMNSWSGVFRVSAGIDAENYEQARILIFDLLEDVKAGKFTAQALDETKKQLRNNYFMGQDNVGSLISEAYLTAEFPERHLTETEWLDALDKVTAEDVSDVAKKLVFQAEYFLKGVN